MADEMNFLRVLRALGAMNGADWDDLVEFLAANPHLIPDALRIAVLFGRQEAAEDVEGIANANRITAQQSLNLIERPKWDGAATTESAADRQLQARLEAAGLTPSGDGPNE